MLLALILSATTFGCAKKEPETKTETKTEGATKADHRADDDKATDELQTRRAEEAKATEAKATADTEAGTTHAATHDQLQANFDAADRRFNTLKEKAVTLTGAKRKTADAAVSVAKAHEATVMASIAKLRTASLEQWDAAKVRVESDAVALNKSIDKLETTVK